MQSSSMSINIAIYLQLVILLYIFVVYWWDYRKFRIKNDWTGIYISFNVAVYNIMWDSYNTKNRRIYFWRPKKYKSG